MQVSVPSRYEGAQSIAGARENEEDRQDVLYFGTIKIHVSGEIHILHMLHTDRKIMIYQSEPDFIAYLTTPSSDSVNSSRGLHMHVAFNTCAGVHSRLMRRDKCIAENIHALVHATVASTAKNTLSTCLKERKEYKCETCQKKIIVLNFCEQLYNYCAENQKN